MFNACALQFSHTLAFVPSSNLKVTQQRGQTCPREQRPNLTSFNAIGCPHMQFSDTLLHASISSHRLVCQEVPFEPWSVLIKTAGLQIVHTFLSKSITEPEGFLCANQWQIVFTVMSPVKTKKRSHSTILKNVSLTEYQKIAKNLVDYSGWYFLFKSKKRKSLQYWVHSYIYDIILFHYISNFPKNWLPRLALSQTKNNARLKLETNLMTTEFLGWKICSTFFVQIERRLDGIRRFQVLSTVIKRMSPIVTLRHASLRYLTHVTSRHVNVFLL